MRCWTWIGMVMAAALLFALSFFNVIRSNDPKAVASHASDAIGKRMDLLDSFAEKLLDTSTDIWPEVGKLPEDMVLYRYVDDTLNYWCNLFSVDNDEILPITKEPYLSDGKDGLDAPLSRVSEQPSLMNMGHRWYVVKSYTRRNVKLIGGLLVQDKLKENLLSADNGVNPLLHVQGEYSVVGMMDDGEAVTLHGLPMFKVVSVKSYSADKYGQTAVLLRIVAAMLFAVALVLRLYGRKSLPGLSLTVFALAAVAAVFRVMETDISREMAWFSPSLYAHNGLLDTFGTLLFFNAILFLMALCVYGCRHRISEALSGRKLAGWITVVCGVAFFAVAVMYIVKSLKGLILNSDIAMEPLKFPMMTIYTLYVYVSYLLLLLGLFLWAETVVSIAGSILGRKLSLRRKNPLVVCAVLFSGMLCWVVISTALSKEENRIENFTLRLALDRDLVAETVMMGREYGITGDPVLGRMCLDGVPGRIISQRLEELYLSGICSDYDIKVTPVNMHTPSEILRMVDGRLNECESVAKGSRFMYDVNPAAGVRYCAFFTYTQPDSPLCGFLLELTPHVSSSLAIRPLSMRHTSSVIPPFYSYARYKAGRLVAFKGNFAYPMMLPSWASDGVVKQDGYRHFIHHISDEECIAVSREDRNLISGLVMFSILAISIGLLMGVFRIRRAKTTGGRGHLGARMKRIMIESLFSTMAILALVSVFFVGAMMERDRNNMMSAKISSVQLMLDACIRDNTSYEQLFNAGFADGLDQTARTSSSDIFIYSPSGRLIMASSPDLMDMKERFGRIDSDAFKHIIHGHERFYIVKSNFPFRAMLYAPIMNSSGNTLAIACVPYVNTDKHFSRDVFFHTGTMLSAFALILFIVTLVISSVANSIFQPLRTLGKKMKAADPQTLEPIEYNGNDEISVLVKSYNEMVATMRSGTVRLAEAERNKAWSEMARQVAHEIKNPLTPIKLELQRIMRLKQKGDPSWESKFDKASDVILEHIDILSETASEFSTFARLYSEAPVEFDLDRALQDQLALFDDKGVDITYLGTEGACLTGPRPQLIRVFFNILNNAIQAVEGVEEPKILVSLRRADMPSQDSGQSSSIECWAISVEDNGPGVAEENRERLFTPNFTTKSGGTGLGLAICKNVVDNCGGKITYSRSFSLGGACFQIFLPVV